MTLDLMQRFERLPAPSIAESLAVTPGSLRDYARLAEHHYRAGRPATAARVLVLRRRQSAAPEPAAVLVESLPTLSCRLRDYALRGRYGPCLTGKQRAAMLRDEVRCISRVVVDPRWRGLGLAARLVRHALDTAQTPMTEALAAMGEVHPFFETAGMTPYRRPPHAFDARLIAAMAVVGLTPADLTRMRRVQRHLGALDPHRRTWLMHELHRWARHAFGRGSARPQAAEPVWAAARRRLLLPPVYYLHVNDGARERDAARRPLREGGA